MYAGMMLSEAGLVSNPSNAKQALVGREDSNSRKQSFLSAFWTDFGVEESILNWIAHKDGTLHTRF